MEERIPIRPADANCFLKLLGEEKREGHLSGLD